MTNPDLIWRSAGTENPGDQQADAPDGYYSLGPNTHPDGWNLTFVSINVEKEVQQDECDLGNFHTEAAAKDLAQRTANTASTGVQEIQDEDEDCGDACTAHTPDCDGYCDHGTATGPHINACLPDMSAPSKNENCIDGLRCPRCGAEDAFNITVTCVVRMTDNGSDDPSDIEWDSTSPIACTDTDCGHTGTVAQFTVTPVSA